MQKSFRDQCEIGIQPWPNNSSVSAHFFNRNAIASDISDFSNQVRMKQIHGNIIATPEINSWNGTPCDGLVTSQRNFSLVVQTADCLPLLGFTSKAIGVCHSGWKGLESGVIEAWIELLLTRATNRGEIKVALGPSIQKCHFEVGLDIGARLTDSKTFRLSKKEIESVTRPHSSFEKIFIDLTGLTKIHLFRMGLKPEQISSSPDCTFCNPFLYFSYRKEKGAGRNEAMISFRRD